MPYTFPFEVPADLTALSAEEFAAFAALVEAHATAMSTDDAASSEALIATRTLFTTTRAEGTRRDTEATEAAAARAEMSAALAEPVVTDPAPVVTDPAPVVTDPAPVAVVPAVVVPSTIETPVVEETPAYATMTASAGSAGRGGALTNFNAAGVLLDNQLASYGGNPRGGTIVANGKGRFTFDSRTMRRDGGVQFNRAFPEDLVIRDGKNAMEVLDHAADEKRLHGNSLIAAMTKSVEKDGKALTAAIGWCAPSETIYDLCALETLDGMLDIAEIQATRGGFFVPEFGGPNFGSIYDSIGDDGDVILTEYEIENGTEKVCIEIPCPDFVEVRLDVAYLCLTGSLLQRRGYPEAVTRFSQGAMVALAHKVNESVIARIVAQSGAAIVISADASGDDAVSSLLSAVELAIEDMKYRNRMARNATVEVVLPAWVIAPMRAALARRTGVAEYDVSDAQILAAFTTRHAVPRFVYDWQDAYSGLSGGPGAQTAITAWPANVQFLIYPAGTWVKPVRDVVNLDTVYDNAMLTQNQYTALFTEDGFNVIQMCVESRLYQVPIDPSGVVGCCP